MKLFSSREDMKQGKTYNPQQGWLDKSIKDREGINANPMSLTGLFGSKKENPFRECQQPRPKR